MSFNRVRGSIASAALAFVLAAFASNAFAAPDFSGVWGMVQHDRKGAGLINQVERSVLKRLPDVSC